MYPLPDRFLRQFRWPALATSLVGLLICLAYALPAWAQESVEAAPVDEKSYVLCYTLVGLAIALGLVVACRPSSRADRPHMPEKNLEAKIKKVK